MMMDTKPVSAISRPENVTLVVMDGIGVGNGGPGDAVANDMLEETKNGEYRIKTAHSLNPVPLIIYDRKRVWNIKKGDFGLANVAPTVADILQLKAPDCWKDGII